MQLLLTRPIRSKTFIYWVTAISSVSTFLKPIFTKLTRNHVHLLAYARSIGGLA
jgi:hypothetical protein